MSNKDNYPDINGFFGEYGGKFVPETLMYALDELETTYQQLKDNPEFLKEFYNRFLIFISLLLFAFGKIDKEAFLQFLIIGYYLRLLLMILYRSSNL